MNPARLNAWNLTAEIRDMLFYWRTNRKRFGNVRPPWSHTDTLIKLDMRNTPK